MDDIVTRIRGYDFMRDGDIPDVIMGQAADEIERLRKDLVSSKAKYVELLHDYLNLKFKINKIESSYSKYE